MAVATTKFTYKMTEHLRLRQTSTGYVTCPLTRSEGDAIPSNATVSAARLLAVGIYEYSSWREFKIRKGSHTGTVMSDALRSSGGASSDNLIATAHTWDLYTDTPLYTDLTTVVFAHSESSTADAVIIGFPEGSQIVVTVEYTALPILDSKYPADAALTSTGKHTLSVVFASHGAPKDYAYQWYKNGVAISSATAGTLEVTPQGTAAEYYCRVTNSAGTVQTRTATVGLSGGANIVDGDQMCAAMPYVYTNGKWQNVVPYVYSNGSFHVAGIGASADGPGEDDSYTEEDFETTDIAQFVLFSAIRNAPIEPIITFPIAQRGSGKPSITNRRPVVAVSSVTVSHRGANLLKMPEVPSAHYDNLIWSCSNGMVQMSGAVSSLFMDIAGQAVVPPGSYRTHGYSDKVSVIALVYENGAPVYYANGAVFGVGAGKVLDRVFCQVAPGVVVDELLCPMLVPSTLSVTEPEPYKGADYTVNFPDKVYLGTLNWKTGVLSSYYKLIESYAGETIPTDVPWYSDRDEWSDGALPSTGAQVAYYSVDASSTKQFELPSIKAFKGVNVVFVDTSTNMAVHYVPSAEPVAQDTTVASITVSTDGAATLHNATIKVSADGDAIISRFKLSQDGAATIK